VKNLLNATVVYWQLFRPVWQRRQLVVHHSCFRKAALKSTWPKATSSPRKL